MAAHAGTARNAVHVKADDDLNIFTVHVQEGWQYRTFIRILRQACIQAQLGEVVPTASKDDMACRYVLLNRPSSHKSMIYGGLIYDFNPPAGLLVRRTTLRKRLVCHLVTSASNKCEARQLRKLRRRGTRHERGVCQRAWQRKPPQWTVLPRLTPLALPTDERLEQALQQALQAHNTAQPEEPVYVYPGKMLRCAGFLGNSIWFLAALSGRPSVSQITILCGCKVYWRFLYSEQR